jgi:hypothetical protein
MFSAHGETCTLRWAFIPVSLVRPVDRDYRLCPHCGCIYYRELPDSCSSQPPHPHPRKHRVIMSFSCRQVWMVIFFDADRMRTPLPRKARFTTDEAMLEFIYCAGGPKTLEDRNILAMMMERKSGEITLELTDEQYDKLRKSLSSVPPKH